MAPLYRFADRVRFRAHGNVGRRGEDLAHRLLRSGGFTIVARNWRPPQGGGEIDLIGWEKTPGGDRELVFVEVKARVSDEWNAPERNIDAEKLRALRRTALDYMRRAGVETEEARFDVILIVGTRTEHIRNAFPLVEKRLPGNFAPHSL